MSQTTDAGGGTVADQPTLRIGEVAKRTDVTTRTLRYWEALGIFSPSSHRESGERLYTESDVELVTRIRELQVLLGFSLSEVRAVLETDAVLDRVRAEYRAADTRVDRRRKLLQEAIGANDRLLTRLDDTLTRVHEFRDDRAAKAKRLRAALRNLDAAPAAAGRAD